jgi:hypothetical protein
MQRTRFALFVAALVASVTQTVPVAAQSLDSTVTSGFRWRTVGPANFMGRLSDVVGIPGPSKTLYIAAAAGGIWKTTNNGITWRPLFDDKNVSSMGMLAIAPSDTNVIWAGTGEPNSRNSIEPGAGVYKSTDGGTRWTFMGLEKTQHIGRIAIDPRNANVVYVAALGPAWKAGGDRGLYKTTDGGTTWKLIKAGANALTGFIDVALDPSNPDIVYAAAWERFRTPYSLKSGGPGSGLWKSTDAGATWTEIKGSGYPTGVKGRIGLAIARSNPQVVYALTEAADTLGSMTYTPINNPPGNGLYRSTDGGRTWTKMNNINTRPFYYSQVRVDPKNPDRVYFSSTQLQVSNDGGKTNMNAAQSNHVDDHGLWIDPNDPERWVLASDGGVHFTYDKGGNFWYPMNLPLAQFYEVSYDFAVPYNICGGAQDNGSWCGPSRRRQSPNNNTWWFTIAGGDGFYTAQDPTDPMMVWGESQGGNVSQRNLRTGENGRVNKPNWNERYRMWEDSIAIARGDVMQPATREATAKIASLRERQRADSIALSIRYNWNSPFFLSPHNPQVFYMGGSRVLKSVKRGEDMFPISPDLSVKTDAALQKIMEARIDTADRWTGGITLDATGAETYGTVVTLAESPVKPGLLIAGTDNGNLWITHNDGATWENMIDRVPGLPTTKDTYVARVEPSHFDTLTFYVAFDNHRWNDFTPYVYATSDGGRTFRSIANNLPNTSPADYLHVIRESPNSRDLLFVGSSQSVYVSIDRGRTWTKFASNLPSTPVYDLKIHPRDRELIAATHGRGFWIVDIAALEQMTPRVMAAGTHLFKPRVAFQWGEAPQLNLPGNGWAQAIWTSANPPFGADIVYNLAANAAGPPRFVVTSGAGDTSATITGPGGAGIHRVSWNFQLIAPRGAPAEQTPAQRRDSILLRVRAPMVLDSLQRAGFDTAAISRARQQVNAMNNPQLLAGGGRGGRGGGGGGGRGGGGGGQACEHPSTAWEQFCARPAETAGGRGGGGGGGGFGGLDSATAAAFAAPAAGGRGAAGGGRGGRGGRGGQEALDPIALIWSLIGMPQPSVGGRGGRGGGGGFAGFAGGGGIVTASTGDYTVTMTVGGQTFKQSFRVERVSGGEDTGGGGGDDEERDGKSPKAKAKAKSR